MSGGSISRRGFIRSALLYGAGILSAGPLAWVSSRASGRRGEGRPPVPRRVLADLHVHPMINAWNRSTALGVEYPLLAKLVEKTANPTSLTWETCHQAGIDVLCAAHFNVFDEWLSMPTDPNPEAPVNTLRMMDMLEQELEGKAAPYARLARNWKDLDRMVNSIPKQSPDYRVAVVHALEGGHSLGGDLRALDTFAKRGVAIIGLTHFFNKGVASAANPYPYFPDANSAPAHQGLSPFGKQIIERMEELGIIVDITHCTSTAVADVLEAAQKPLIATHSSVRTLGDHPYSLSDEHIQEIARRGGIIGIILYPYVLSNYGNAHLAERHGSLNDVVRTIRYVRKICGTHKCIGIGSDFSGFITGPKEISRLDEIDQLRRMLLEEFDNDVRVVEDMMAQNVIDFLLRNWKSGMQSGE